MLQVRNEGLDDMNPTPPSTRERMASEYWQTARGALSHGEAFKAGWDAALKHDESVLGLVSAIKATLIVRDTFRELGQEAPALVIIEQALNLYKERVK